MIHNIAMKKAFVFPGQGAQFVGMGKDLYDNNPVAHELLNVPTKSLVSASPT